MLLVSEPLLFLTLLQSLWPLEILHTLGQLPTSPPLHLAQSLNGIFSPWALQPLAFSLESRHCSSVVTWETPLTEGLQWLIATE